MKAEREITPMFPGAPPWFRPIAWMVLPGPTTPVLDTFLESLTETLSEHGHIHHAALCESTDLVLTTSTFGEVRDWHEAPLFALPEPADAYRAPEVCTLVHARGSQLQRILRKLESALKNETADPADYGFPGLGPTGYRIVHEQGRRGGAILALGRLLQVHAKSVRVMLVVGDTHPTAAYHFDLVGAHPCTRAPDSRTFCRDVALRLMTAAAGELANRHRAEGEPIPRTQWERLSAVETMQQASRRLACAGFFSHLVRVADLVDVPVAKGMLASHYSEGCFATWEPALDALVATASGTGHAVDKSHIGADDLSLVTGVRDDRLGAIFRPVEGAPKQHPSSESMELMRIVCGSRRVSIRLPDGEDAGVPLARSVLHGHRGIASYDPGRIEYVPLAKWYHRYPVGCASHTQAEGVTAAFGSSKVLNDPRDPRQLSFTVIPGHGIVIVEKWLPGKRPFDAILEAMEAGALRVCRPVPQGPFAFERGTGHAMELRDDAV